MSIEEKIRLALRHLDPDEAVSLAQTLVRTPSVSGREGQQIAHTMADWLRSAGVEAGVQVFGPDRANVYARLDGGGPGPKLLLNGHLDTKPGDNMTIDPYGGEIRDGRLWGRGACDMKSAVAAEMAALKAIHLSGVPFRGTLWFGSEAGEDGGGWKFVDLLSPGPIDCDCAVVGEPTEMELHIGCRGGFRLTLTARGRATHTGMSERGVNAILKMTGVIPIIYQLPCFNEVDPIWGRCPVNSQDIHGGGEVTASVPDKCVAVFDIRLNPNVKFERANREIEAALRSAIAADPELKLEWEISTAPRESAHLDAAHPFVAEVSDGIALAANATPKIGGFPGGCAVFPLAERGIPTVVYGPGSLEQAHTRDEWIRTDEIVAAARAYVGIALRVLS